MHVIYEAIDDSDSDFGPELISLDALKLELGITGTTEDEWLEANITRWSKIIAEYTGREFAFSAARETFIFDDCERSRPAAGLPLRLYPIIEIESVTVSDSEVAVVSDVASGVVWREDRGSWSGTVVVEYTGGFDLPDGAPAALQLAVIEAIRGRRSTAAASSGGGVATTGVRSITHGDTTITYSDTTQSSSSLFVTATAAGLPLTVAELIKPFKRLVV